MVPDADLQLQVVIKALVETVAPAVDPSNKVAIEQLHLVLGTLKLLREHLPLTRRFVRALLTDAVDLGEQVANAVAVSERREIDEALIGARKVLNDPAVESWAIEAARSNLTDKTVKIVASVGEGARDHVEKIVLEQSQYSIERFRAWFIGSGFEPKASEIPAISTLL